MMHIGLPIGEDNILMASDTLKSLGHELVFPIGSGAAAKAESARVCGISMLDLTHVLSGPHHWGFSRHDADRAIGL
jgi:hypothetical protein